MESSCTTNPNVFSPDSTCDQVHVSSVLIVIIQNVFIEPRGLKMNLYSIEHTTKLLTEIEAAKYMVMSPGFLRQDRMNDFRKRRTNGLVWSSHRPPLSKMRHN